MRKTLFVIITLLTLAGCGQKGPLIVPQSTGDADNVSSTNEAADTNDTI